jgi:translation initiation factor IF-2
MKQGKKDVDKSSKGTECGISMASYEAYEVGDIIQTLEEVREIQRL